MESAELDLSAPVSVNPVYSYMEIMPNQGQTFALGGSALPIQLKVPAQTVFNLAESYCEFDMLVGAPTAVAKTVVHVNKLPFDQIVMRAGSTVLADIQDLDIYTKAVVPFTMPFNKYNSRSAIRWAGTVAGSVGLNTFCQPTKLADPNALPVADVVALQITGAYVTHAAAQSSTAVLAASGNSDGEASRQNVSIAGSQVAQGFRNIVNFSDLSHSIFALNKNLYFGDAALEIVLTTSIRDKVCYMATQAAGATSLVTTAGANDATATVTISNFILYLAVETMPQNIQNIMDRYRSGGLQIMTPYVNSFKQGLGTATSGSYNQQLSNAYGISLSRIYNVFYRTENSLHLAANTDNVNAAKIVDYQSRLGTKYLQPAKVNSATGQDWKYHRQMLEGSALNSERAWKINNVLCDNFASSKPAAEWNKEDEDIGGLALSGTSVQYYLQFTKTAQDLTQNTYVITSTSFNVSPAGVFRSVQA